MRELCRPIVHFPIETKPREFDSRCLIALECARLGALSVIGPASILPYRTPHVVLLKSASRFESLRIKDEQRMGAVSAVLDEEGLVHTGNRLEHAMRYSQETLDAVDRVFLNGENEKDVLREYYRLDDSKCVVTGNPRFDFYKPDMASYYDEDARRINEVYGRVILIPSRFGNVNLAQKIDFLEFQSKVRKLDPVSEMPIYEAFQAHSKIIFDSFIEMLPLVAARFPKCTIIVRPHPSERHDVWQEASRSLSNVRVISEGPIGPWIRAASAVIHNGCTTGLEAFMMGRAVFAYMPETSEVYDLHLPNEASTKITKVDDLLDVIDEALNGAAFCTAAEHERREAFISHHLANIGSRYAYRTIAEELVLLARRHPAGIGRIDPPFGVRCMIKAKSAIRRAFANMYRMGLPVPRFAADAHYGFQKNPGVAIEELKQYLSRLAPIIGVETTRVQVEKIDSYRFCISLASASEA